jgi:uncharacterized protein (TIGR01370 family)
VRCGSPCRAPAGNHPRAPSRQARSWSYQLQNYNLRQLQASAADILVLDDSVGIDSRGRRTPTTLNRLQKKPDGSRRFVLAYLSIGEAEDCRYYWQPEWIEAAEASQPQPDPARPKETDQPQDQPAAPTAPAAAAAPASAPPIPAKPEPLPVR